MSNFLLVARHEQGNWDLNEALDDLSRGVPDERTDGALGSGWSYSWFSHRARKDVVPEGGLFTGFAVHEENEVFCFGSSGWRRNPQPSPRAELPGCYVRAHWTTRRLTIHGDLYRMMPIFMTAENGLLLVSDSAYALVQLRRRLQLPVTMDHTVARTMLWPNSMAAQLLGSRVLASEVQYVTVGGRIEIDLSVAAARARVKYTDVHATFAPRSDSYSSEIRSAAVRIASLVHSVAASGPEHARLALSGGKDSRICLAAALLSPAAGRGAVFSCTNTQPYHRRDYEVVQSLASEFGFSLGSRLPPDHETRAIRRFPKPFALWMTDQSLCYFPFKIQSYALAAAGPFSIAGLGSELYKGNYGLRTLPQLIHSLATREPGAAHAVEEIAGEALRAAGVAPQENQSLEWHYLLLRNALHGGRFAPATKLGLRPLQQASLVGTAKEAGTGRFPELERSGQIPDDLLALLSPALAARPFDKASKNQSPSAVIDRLRRLGGPVSVSEISEYRMLGSAHDVLGGPLRSLARLVPDDVASLRMSRGDIVPVVDAAAERIEGHAPAPEWVRAARAAARTLRDPLIPVAHSRGDVGRVLAVAAVLD
ncbi:hypothetical protein [Kocuria rhizophila]|uniref:hypothetical protein n=1 Tax=Kocuria rhizophila TaxID=72000 RepID=UPI003D6EA5ED